MKFLPVILLCFLYQKVSSYRILAVLPAPSKSHTYIGQSLMKGLAENGHEVFVISPFKEKNPIENYTEVFLENSWIESRKSNILKSRTYLNDFLQFFKQKLIF